MPLKLDREGELLGKENLFGQRRLMSSVTPLCRVYDTRVGVGEMDF